MATEFDVFCPTCNMLVAAKVIADGRGGSRSDAVSPVDWVDAEYHGEHYFTCLCGRCSQPFLIQQSLYGIPSEFESVTDETLLYPSEGQLNLTGVPNTIKSAYDQASRSLSASLFEPCVLMCRKCLEATCKNLNTNGRDLNSRLQSLYDCGHIDKRLLDWAHQIRLIGNSAAHDPDLKVSKRDARDVLDFTEAILIYVYSLTARFVAFQSRHSKSQTTP